MHNVWLIAKREYLERIRTKAFMAATILIPMLLGTLVFGSVYFANKTKSSAHVAVVAENAGFANDLKRELDESEKGSMTVEVYAPAEGLRERLAERLKGKGDLTGYMWVEGPASAGERPVFRYVPRSAGDLATEQSLRTAVQVVLTREGLREQGMSAAGIEGLMRPVKMDTSATGDTRTAFYAAYLFFIMMYMAIMLYGMNTARSIIEEKTSRVFEVMLATITPEEMLAGKILGVGAVGLTQIAVWMAAVGGLGSYYAVVSGVGHGHSIVSGWQIVSFVVYFVFGFLLYSSIAAALGSMTNSEQELQQLNMFMVLPLAFCMLVVVVIVNAPDSTLARVVSLIPFCSPLLMNFRVAIGNPQPWEIGLSLVLMSVTIVAILWVASRIYRVGILMYGKKPNLPEILRWLKYS